MELNEKTETKKGVFLEKLTREIVETMEISASSKHLHLSFVGEENPCFIGAEINPVKIILKNLLDNAIKFSNRGDRFEVHLLFSEDKIL